MANGVCKFIYQNLIPGASAITSTGQAPGIITAAIKTGTGSASLTPSGVYTGSRDQEFLVQIDSTASGTEVGQSNYSWAGYASTGDPTAWDATGVVTHSGTGALSDGVEISFASAAGADFALGDKWQFKGLAPFGVSKLLDWDRNSVYKSATLISSGWGNMVLIDMGSTTYVADYICILDSNLATNSSGYVVGADDTGLLSSQNQYNFSNTPNIPIKLSTVNTNRYLLVSMIDPTNPDGKVSFSEVVVGKSWSPSVNYDVNKTAKFSYIQNSQVTPSGVRNTRYYNNSKSWTLRFSYLPATDFANFKKMFETIVDKNTGKKQPFIWAKQADSTGISTISTNIKLVECDGYTYTLHPGDKYSLDLTLTEVVKND